MIRLSWSDRDCWVYQDDVDGIADVILSCAFDHCYDRGNGVPYGFSLQEETRLKSIVADHLSRFNPKWEDNTVYCDHSDPRYAVFYQAIVSELLGNGDRLSIN
jgi:hypothetical protein